MRAGGRQRGKAIATTLAICGLLAGCGASAPLSSRPDDFGSARALARSVAERARCTGFEDYATARRGWDFTCQRGERMFLIRALISGSDRDATVRALGADGKQAKAGGRYVVWEFESAAADRDGLSAFPGNLNSVQRKQGDVQ